MKSLFLILSLWFVVNSAYGASNEKASADKPTVSSKNVKKIKVHGMSCPLCLSKTEKKFKKVSSVENVHVDLDTMLITLDLKKGADLPEKKIKPIVNSLGLTFVEVVK